MSEPELQLPKAPESSGSDKLLAQMRQVDRREWWLWSTGAVVMLLLTMGIASFTFTGSMKQAEAYYSFNLGQAVRGVLGLVLLFTVYSIYQQFEVKRIRRHLAEQIAAMAKGAARIGGSHEQAMLDPLTGLYCQDSGEQRLAEEISRAQRHDRPLSVLLLDLDGLKKVNEGYGRTAGDLVLKSFAEQLSKVIRDSDVAVRLGGDEFLVVFPECRAEGMKHLLARLSEPQIDCGGQVVSSTFSAGWTAYRSGDTAKDLLKRADYALHLNKGLGKESSGAKAAAVV